MNEHTLVGFDEEQMKIIQAYRRSEVIHRDKIKAQAAEIERLREATYWIPVSERLPEKSTTDLGEEYLVMLGGSYNIVAPMNYDREHNEWYSGGWGTARTRWNRVVTHWMPLPGPNGADQ